MEPKLIVEFAKGRVDARLRAWGAPNPNHIDYEADEFRQQASIDLWMALTRRPRLAKRGMESVVRRSMAQLLRKRLGPAGRRSMIRMCKESLDSFEAPDSDSVFVLCDTFDYIATKMGRGAGVILDCFKRGASITDIIDALQMSVSSFYVRLNRIRKVLEN